VNSCTAGLHVVRSARNRQGRRSHHDAAHILLDGSHHPSRGRPAGALAA
jgi:hypothetical protein